MSGYDKVLEEWALARGIGYPRSCQECPERKEGCYKNCRFIKAYKNENDVPRYIKLPQPEYLPPTVEELEAFAAKLYQSPIEIIMQEMQTPFDGEVFKATQAYGINVDKDELIKALKYDRDQYDKGFADGSRLNTDAIRAEVAREICCKIEEEIVAALESNYRAMREHNLKRCPDSDGLFLERIYGKIDALRGIEGFVEELKKKYTEGEI